MAPKVSIIIPFYNCSYIDQAILSALNQTYTNKEIIVIDDGSTQYSDLIEPYLNKIFYIKKENGGTASALNTGIKNATGQYFVWLSSDDLFVPSKVEKQLNFMKSRNSSISYTSIIKINSNNDPISKPQGKKYPDKLHFLKDLRRYCPINGCTVMMKMEIFKEIGMFDESLPFTHDYDFWLRAIQKYEFHFLDEPLVFYRIHDEMGTKKFIEKMIVETEMVRKKYRKILNKLILMEKNRTRKNLK